MMPSSRIPNSSETITVVNILYNNDQRDHVASFFAPALTFLMTTAKALRPYSLFQLGELGNFSSKKDA